MNTRQQIVSMALGQFAMTSPGAINPFQYAQTQRVYTNTPRVQPTNPSCDQVPVNPYGYSKCFVCPPGSKVTTFGGDAQMQCVPRRS